MFTSRAEYRLLLREDNADSRLTPIGRELGLVNDERWAVFSAKQEAVTKETARLSSYKFSPEKIDQGLAKEVLGEPLNKVSTGLDLLRRPEVDYGGLLTLMGEETQLAEDISEQVVIQTKYAGYIDRQKLEIERLQRHETTVLPDELDYQEVRGLSNEVREKLAQARPNSLGQAARISGVTPAAISLLLVHLKRSDQQGKQANG
jgi:tRNA uridine 5-carboxymethylaminomethyl modification enzyme